MNPITNIHFVLLTITRTQTLITSAVTLVLTLTITLTLNLTLIQMLTLTLGKGSGNDDLIHQYNALKEAYSQEMEKKVFHPHSNPHSHHRHLELYT